MSVLVWLLVVATVAVVLLPQTPKCPRCRHRLGEALLPSEVIRLLHHSDDWDAMTYVHAWHWYTIKTWHQYSRCGELAVWP